MVVQQTVNANKDTYFVRTRSNGSGHFGSNITDKVENKAEVAALRKEIETIKE